MAHQDFGVLAISGHGALHVSKIMPPQFSHGPGQGIGSELIVVSPHMKQIQALLRTPSPGPTILSGMPRRLIKLCSSTWQM
jgi:hypothetical protein